MGVFFKFCGILRIPELYTLFWVSSSKQCPVFSNETLSYEAHSWSAPSTRPQSKCRRKVLQFGGARSNTMFSLVKMVYNFYFFKIKSANFLMKFSRFSVDLVSAKCRVRARISIEFGGNCRPLCFIVTWERNNLAFQSYKY